MIIPILGLALLSTAAKAESSMLKCGASPTYRVEIDGKIVGELRDNEPNTIVRSLQSDNLYSLQYVCVRTTDAITNEVRIQTVMQIVTKTGLEPMLRSYLTHLVERQREFRTAKGRYAATLHELSFFENRTPVPIEMVVEGSDWLASASFGKGSPTCYVAVGSATSPVPGIRRGAVTCRAEESVR